MTLRADTYTANGLIDLVADGNGNAIDFDYDGFERLARTTYEDATFEAVESDAAGNVTQLTTRAGEMVSYQYDALGRETLADAPASFDDVATAYDAAGRLDTVTVNASAVFDHAYDSAGRLIAATRPDGKSVAYGYDANGNRTSLSYPGAALVVRYEHDALDRPTAVKEGAVSVASYGYPSLLSATTSYVNGTSTTWTTTLGGDLARIAHSFDGEAVTFELHHNGAGQLTNRVVSEAAYAWNPAAPGTLGYTPNSLNQYASVGATTYTHDANGNLSGDGTASYGYDYQNRLTAATLASVTTSYAFDPFGRRASRTVGAGPTETFVHDGATVLEEYASGTPETLVARYVHGPGIDNPIYMERAGARYYYHLDATGSVVALTDASGAVVERHAYGPFGESTTTSALGNPYRFTARRLDAETGLYYFRARMYSAALGRFVQVDPLGIADQLHLYAYVANDPINFTDPDGQALREIGRDALSLHVDQTARLIFSVTGVPSDPNDPRGRVERVAPELALPAVGALRFLRAARGSMLFSQASVKSTFAYGPHAGRTVGEVAQGLRAGTMSADTSPIDYVVRSGQAIALNNRSLLALTRAGMQPTVTRNLTGNQAAEALLNSHLQGGVPSTVIRVRGGPPGTSLIE